MSDAINDLKTFASNRRRFLTGTVAAGAAAFAAGTFGVTSPAAAARPVRFGRAR